MVKFQEFRENFLNLRETLLLEKISQKCFFILAQNILNMHKTALNLKNTL